MIINGTSINAVNCTLDGNSIFNGFGLSAGQRMSDLLYADTTLNSTFLSVKANIAVGGQTTVDMINRQSSFLFSKYEARCRRNIVFAMEVRNDLYFGVSDADALTNIKTYCQNAVNRGFDVCLVIETPSTGGSDPTGGSPVNRTQAQLETSRLWVRSQLLSDFSTQVGSQLYTPNSGINYATMLLDLGDPISLMGNVSTCSNLTYYQDGTHWTATANTTLKPLFVGAINYYYNNIYR